MWRAAWLSLNLLGLVGVFWRLASLLACSGFAAFGVLFDRWDYDFVYLWCFVEGLSLI